MTPVSMPGATVRVQLPSKACCSGRGRNLASCSHASADGSHSCAEGVPRYNSYIVPSAHTRILSSSACDRISVACKNALGASRSCIALHA